MGYYPQEVIQLAQTTQQLYGVPASVTLAQYALESDYGSSALAKSANNYFGITGSYNGQSVTRNGRKWRQYSTMKESFFDHAELLTKPLYATKTKDANNAFDYARAIADTYAPPIDGNYGYADKLVSIMKQDNLTQYDDPATWGKNTVADGGIIMDTLSSATPTGWVKDKATTIVSYIIKYTAVLLLLFFGIVFFMTAFDTKNHSVKKTIKKTVKKNKKKNITAEAVESGAAEAVEVV